MAGIGLRTWVERLRWPKRPTGGTPETALVGRWGEEQAYWFLRQRGYTIVARNYREPPRRGEVDLIARDGNEWVFVEVKTRSARTAFPAEQAVDRDKRRHLIAVARSYARRRGIGRYRFDVVAVYGDRHAGAAPEIVLHRRHFEAAPAGRRA